MSLLTFIDDKNELYLWKTGVGYLLKESCRATFCDVPEKPIDFLLQKENKAKVEALAGQAVLIALSQSNIKPTGEDLKDKFYSVFSPEAFYSAFLTGLDNYFHYLRDHKDGFSIFRGFAEQQPKTVKQNTLKKALKRNLGLTLSELYSGAIFFMVELIHIELSKDPISKQSIFIVMRILSDSYQLLNRFQIQVKGGIKEKTFWRNASKT